MFGSRRDERRVKEKVSKHLAQFPTLKARFPIIVCFGRRVELDNRVETTS